MNFPIYRLFIIGAGFSAPAGLPLGKDLLERVREEVRLVFRDFGWEGSLEQEIGEWTSLYPGQPVDLERVLAYSHRKHYLRLLGSDEYFEHGSRSIAATRTAIQRILIQATPSDTPTLYRNFAERLCPNDVVLAFNYDTLLEQTLDDIGKPYTLTPEWWLKTDPGGFEPKFVDLLKLHGSIDWYDRYYHDTAMRRHREEGHDVPNRDPIFGPAPSEPLSRGPTEGFGRHILPRVFRVPNHTEYFPIEGGPGARSVGPLRPPPGLRQAAWVRCHPRPLGESSPDAGCLFVTVVIGYSMPSYDSYAYEALGRLFVDYQQGGDTTYWEQRRVPIQLVTLDDSEEPALKSIPFLEPDKTRVWNQGFSTDSLNWIDWGGTARALGGALVAGADEPATGGARA